MQRKTVHGEKSCPAFLDNNKTGFNIVIESSWQIIDIYKVIESRNTKVYSYERTLHDNWFLKKNLSSRENTYKTCTFTAAV